MPVMKHLLRTASFAKKFTDKSNYEQDYYVNVVKHLIVLTKLRHSKDCARAITHEQFHQYKAKKMLKLLYKYRDYQLALCLIDNLNYRQYLPQVYENWATTLLTYSNLDEHKIKDRLTSKFKELKAQIA